ncbi:hypothetical protein [Rhodocyclus tenuis]|uniref:Tetratricopeptide repeat protein n=1 Tax=Rhodocyclus tenuis TaxID=1066 RepID=A0A840GC06_RHOTE|nr:hypothetical protein [Rhodocyclus tenuis]MBB4248410.1 hypothetical protein [Rhodocyclus tenuis]
MKISTFLFLCISALTLAACEQAQQKTADLLRPPTSVEINLRVLKLAEEGKPADAVRLGEDFLKSTADTEGSLHATLAKLYMATGDTESAVRHMQMMNKGSSVSTTVIVTKENPAPPAQLALPPSPSALDPSNGGAAASIGPNGIEVRAGGARASITN